MEVKNCDDVSQKRGCEGMTSYLHSIKSRITAIQIQYNVSESTIYITFIQCNYLLLFWSRDNVYKMAAAIGRHCEIYK